MAADLALVLRGLPWTLALTLAAMAMGGVLGLPLMLMRCFGHGVVPVLAGAVITLIRSVPPIVVLFVIFFGLGTGFMRIDPFPAAVLGFGLIAAANMAEIYRGGILAIPRGQWEAATALGLDRVHAFIDVVAPQMVRVSLPSTASYAIGLLKDTAIASTIGVGELAFEGYRLSQQTFRGLDVFAMVALVYILISLPVAWASRYADRRLRARGGR